MLMYMTVIHSKAQRYKKVCIRQKPNFVGRLEGNRPSGESYGNNGSYENNKYNMNNKDNKDNEYNEKQ